MYNDDYVNNFGSSGETPPEDNSADTAQQSAPLEPDQIYSAPQQPEQGSYNSQNSYNSGSYTPPQPEKKKKKMSAKKKGVAVFAAILAVVIAVSATVTVLAKRNNNSSSGGTSVTDTSEGDAQLNIAETPKATTTSKGNGVLTSAQIYEKVSPSNVGIVVYSQSSSSASGEGSGIVMG